MWATAKVREEMLFVLFDRDGHGSDREWWMWKLGRWEGGM